MIEIATLFQNQVHLRFERNQNLAGLDLTELDVLLNSGGLLSSNKENSNKSRKRVSSSKKSE